MSCSGDNAFYFQEPGCCKNIKVYLNVRNINFVT